MGKLRNRIPGSSSVVKALPGKLDIKRHSPSILYNLDHLSASTDIVNHCHSNPTICGHVTL